MDIRRYFGGQVSNSKGSELSIKNSSSKNVRKRKLEDKDNDSKKKIVKKNSVIFDSDSDEDPIPPKLKGKKRIQLAEISSDSDEDFKASSKKPSQVVQQSTSSSVKKRSPVKAAPVKNVVSVSEYFSKSPIERSERKIFALKKLDKEIHDDKEFEATLKQIDRQDNLAMISKIYEKKSSIETSKDLESLNKEENKETKLTNKSVPSKKELPTPNKRKTPEKKEIKDPKDKSKKEEKTPKQTNEASVTKNDLDISVRKRTPDKNKQNDSVLLNTSVKSEKNSSKIKTLDSSFTEKNEKSEDKQRNTKYFEYLHRAGPEALGAKLIPEGSEGCFKGKTFVITGVLPSFERDDIANAVIKYGGKVTQSVSRNTSYLVVGRDAGPSKLEKAEKLGTKQLDEDEFLNLIASSKKTNDHSVKTEDCLPAETKNHRKTVTPERKNGMVVKSPTVPKVEKPKVPKVEKPKVEKDSLLEKKEIKKEQSNNEALMWVDKYKPTTTKQIIGQQGDRSNVKKLMHWLLNWHKNNNGEKKKRPPPGKWNDDGSAFKAALLSGPPGVGKTTSATLVCKEAGFSFIELNASDTRSKKSLQTEVQEMLTNRSLSTSFGNNLIDKHCLVMDEVDGMAGNEDRGGIQELIQLIKTARIPIICLCNDRSHPKIRSLVNYCFDLRFQRPRVEQLKGAMMSICCKENLKIKPQLLQELIVSTNQDVRQILHHLSVLNSIPEDVVDHPENNQPKKDTKLNPFDTLKKVFSAQDQMTMSIHDKSDLFFYDYSIAPLFVQENYIHVKPQEAQGDLKKHLNLLSKTADSICDGDLVDRIIRSQSQWGLLPVEAVYASVIPGEFMKGYLQQMISFPSWLGQNSKRGKIDRLLQELQRHMRLKISGSKSDVNVDYSPHIKNAIIHPLESQELEGVPKAVKVMEAYDLLREDLDSLLELGQWSSKSNDPFSKISSKVKAAFTRMYNSDGHLIPYAIASAPKKRSRGSDNTNELEESEVEEEENKDDDDDLTVDAMIKVKKPRNSKTTSAESGPSKGRGRGKRK